MERACATSKKNILVIDPDEDFCRNVRLYLEDNYNVRTRQGMEYIDYSIILYKIDLLLIEADFATKDSIKIISKLKQTHPKLKILVMYVYFPPDRSIEKALARDADDMIAKPFDVDLLKAKVDTLLRPAVQTPS